MDSPRTLAPPPGRDLVPLAEPARRRHRTATGLAAGGGGGARHTAVGSYGERLAARHLEADGLVVVDRNWRCELGEADLVAIAPGRDARRGEAGRRPEALVVCEVKTRTSTRFGGPAQQVTAAKAARLGRLARRWLAEHPDVRPRRVRVDVIGVLVPRAGAPRVDHLVGVGA